ncbi:hypothetical protein [Spongiimicrobium sp. 3-5]|uniref:hypothetical protein n=1 Tax=Spongiimicrobium sp. 3-5 TaxID=3332596 RepID=UPI00397F9981
MRKNIVLLLVTTIILSVSCKDDGEKASQMQQVMAIHDEVMPKMGTLGKLVAELKGKKDTTATGLKYAEAMSDLQQSHTSMMAWMQGFGTRFSSDEIMNGKALTEEKQKWLDEEEVKVKALRDQINTSISKAEKLLAQDKQSK